MRAEMIRSRLVSAGRLIALLGMAFLVAGSGLAQSNGQTGGQSSDQDKQAGQPAASATDKQEKKDKPSADPDMTKLRIRVTGNDKPVAEASVYVRFPQAGGLFHKDKLAELSFKTNQDGSVKVPDIPRGKIQIQVVAKGWHYFGKWYDIDKGEDTILIQLEPPPHWY